VKLQFHWISHHFHFLSQTLTFITQVYFDILFYFIFWCPVLVNRIFFFLFFFIFHLNFHCQPSRLVHLGTSYCYLPLLCHSVSSFTMFNTHTYLIHLMLMHGCLSSKMKTLWSLKTLGTDIHWLSHPKILQSLATHLLLCPVSCRNELFVDGKCHKEQLNDMCCSWFIQDMLYCMYMPIKWWRWRNCHHTVPCLDHLF
jgi:hypothetical protein